MDLDKLRADEEENFLLAKKVLGDSYSLFEDLHDLYDWQRRAVEISAVGAGSENSASLLSGNSARSADALRPASTRGGQRKDPSSRRGRSDRSHDQA